MEGKIWDSYNGDHYDFIGSEAEGAHTKVFPQLKKCKMRDTCSGLSGWLSNPLGITVFIFHQEASENKIDTEESKRNVVTSCWIYKKLGFYLFLHRLRND